MTRISDGEQLQIAAESDEILMKIHRRRVNVGAVALAASCLVHVVLALFFPNFFHVGTTVPAKETKRAFILREVLVPRTDEEQVARARLKQAPAADLSAEAEKAPASLDKSLLEPRLPPVSVGPDGNRNPLHEADTKQPTSTWQPRQDILMITRTLVDESQTRLRPRRYIPLTPRVPDAEDLVYSSDMAAEVRAAAAAGNLGGDMDFSKLDLSKAPVGDGIGALSGSTGVQVVPTEEMAAAGGSTKIKSKRLDKFLVVEARKYASASEPYAYCMLNIRRIGEEMLPVLPKDILLVQDCSASMTEQRLYFCRDGWTNSLSMIRPGDRFNVVRFRDRVERCFPDWVAPEPETLAKAADFVGEMKSLGETDVYGSFSELLGEKRARGRPLIALVVSDGHPTVGETDSSNIIEEFSRLNGGGMSIFAMGTTRDANSYLLDLLGYRNRGDAFVVNGGRWEIPAAIEGRMRGISRPVLTDVKVAFAAACRCDAFPELTGNLFLDRSLVIFCRYPKSLDQLVFQVTGLAGETKCDMVFKLDLASTASAKAELRARWAWQKIYHLTGEYTRTRDIKLLKDRDTIAREYGINPPYQSVLPK
jgi:von Willebrand factor type A domain